MGKRHDALLHLALSCLILPSLLQVPMVASQPSQGGWIVTGMEIVDNKTIVLSGNLIIKGGGSLTLRNVKLRLNVEQNGQYGISVEEGGALSIYNSNISSATAFRFFFYVVGGRFVMKDSELRGAGWGGGADWSEEPRKRGLYVQADDAMIDGNLISDSLGVFLCLSRNSSVSNNRLITDYGITITSRARYPKNNFILNNTIQGSLENGITVAGNSNIVANNTILDAMVSIMLMGSWDNVVTNNRVAPEHHPDPWGGIVLWNWCGNNTIANNTIKTEKPQGIIDGIEVVRSVNNRIEGNIVENLIGGITLSYSHNNVIANNNLSNIWRGTDPMHFYSPSPDAIQLYHSSNNVIINNRVSSVQSNAILLWDMSRNNVLQANVINSSYNGVSLHYSSDNNTVVNNVVSQIGSWTILLDESNENIVYHNSFLDPIIDAYDNGINHWSFDGHGNYWGNYKGQDQDGDGIGDILHCVPPNGTDNFPLMSPKPVTFVPIPILEPASPPVWPPGPKDAVITTEETWKNTAVTLDRITVKNGGTLTVQNMTIMFYTGFTGIRVEPGGSMYIYNSTITAADPRYGGFAFFVTQAKQFVMKNTELHYAGFCFQTDFPGGLSVLATNATIENNTFTHNYRAICVATMFGWVQYPPFVTIANNTISYAYDGVVYDIGDVLGNTVSKIIHAGVFGSISSKYWRQYYFLANNNITQVWTGAIMLNWTEGTWVMNNAISSSDTGVLLLSRVANARITNNTILNCTKGICLFPGSNGTLIYHNNIINSPNSCDFGSNNWDYNGEGNYWNDYTGIDKDGDGIGDIHYSIPQNGTDHYPFMKPNGWILRAVIINPLNGSYLHEKVNITVVGSDPNFDKMELYVSGEQVKTWTESGVQTYRWNTTTLADGSYTLKLTVRDKAGNTKEVKVTVIIDNTPPILEVIQPTQGATIENTTITVIWSVNDITSGIAKLEISVNGGSWTDMTNKTSLTIKDLTEGSHTIKIRATDKVGNTAEKQTTFAVKLPIPYIGIAIAIAVIAITAIAALLIKRRR